jgi:dihydrofolate synthase / folylpolyglutamate synthase
VRRGRVIRSVPGALPARFERCEVRGVPVVVDGGHNEAGLRAALEAVGEVFPGRPLGVVFGVLRDKDIVSMLDALVRQARLLVLTRPDSDRAREPREVLEALAGREAGGLAVRVVTYPGDALDVAVEEMGGADGVVLVTGSLYTAAAVLGRLRAA